MKLRTSLSTREIASAAAVGAVNIVANETDNMLGWSAKAPLQNVTDLSVVGVGAAGFILKKKAGKTGEMGEAIWLADIPLLMGLGWDAIKVYALKQPQLP